MCCSLIQRSKNELFLNRIINCDEKWILYNNSRRSEEQLNESPKPANHFPKPDIHPKKVMITVWWFQGGIIHYNFTKFSLIHLIRLTQHQQIFIYLVIQKGFRIIKLNFLNNQGEGLKMQSLSCSIQSSLGSFQWYRLSTSMLEEAY